MVVEGGGVASFEDECQSDSFLDVGEGVAEVDEGVELVD